MFTYLICNKKNIEYVADNKVDLCTILTKVYETLPVRKRKKHKLYVCKTNSSRMRSINLADFSGRKHLLKQ